MSVSPGSRLGPYEVVAAIGSGGMGEVYRARDPRLERDVAIKILPGTVVADADRLRRFEQEARAAAALNHPNILSVYDIGSHEVNPTSSRSSSKDRRSGRDSSAAPSRSRKRAIGRFKSARPRGRS